MFDILQNKNWDETYLDAHALGFINILENFPNVDDLKKAIEKAQGDEKNK